MILTCQQMKQVEEDAFLTGVKAETLMDEVGFKMAQILGHWFPHPGQCLLWVGKGHNGGDALVAGKFLRLAGWQVSLKLVFPEQQMASLAQKKLREFQETPGTTSPALSSQRIQLDGLLGIGAVGILRDPILSACREINQLRGQGWTTIALDLPTGLNGDTGALADEGVRADRTLTVAQLKKGLIQDKATSAVGRLELIPIAALQTRQGDPGQIGQPIRLLRSFDIHKGICGRVGLIAGSEGFFGAAILCVIAAARSGAGLVTLYCKKNIYPLLAAKCPPEVMVHPVESLTECLDEKQDVLAIGPGLGRKSDPEIRRIVREWPRPLIVDADALNAVSTDSAILSQCDGPRLLTPHPGEMERLFPRNNRSRLEWAEAFTSAFPVTLLLKGARTIISENNHPPVYNPTGTPGMASGGMGDVLTGTIAGLVAQKYSIHDAAVTGAWLCGRAAELAISEGSQSEESLLASDVIAQFGKAFASIPGYTGLLSDAQSKQGNFRTAQ